MCRIIPRRDFIRTNQPRTTTVHNPSVFDINIAIDKIIALIVSSRRLVISSSRVFVAFFRTSTLYLFIRIHATPFFYDITANPGLDPAIIYHVIPLFFSLFVVLMLFFSSTTTVDRFGYHIFSFSCSLSLAVALQEKTALFHRHHHFCHRHRHNRRCIVILLLIYILCFFLFLLAIYSFQEPSFGVVQQAHLGSSPENGCVKNGGFAMSVNLVTFKTSL